MSNDVVEIKAFVPAKDFELSKAFYSDVGFDLKWNDDELAYFAASNSSFFLQNFYNPEHANNFMMHLLVENADDWWRRIQTSGVVQRYGIKVSELQNQPWQQRDFTMIDPTGVLWRVAHNIPASQE